MGCYRSGEGRGGGGRGSVSVLDDVQSLFFILKKIGFVP